MLSTGREIIVLVWLFLFFATFIIGEPVVWLCAKRGEENVVIEGVTRIEWGSAAVPRRH
jgi:hypothetical protein